MPSKIALHVAFLTTWHGLVNGVLNGCISNLTVVSAGSRENVEQLSAVQPKSSGADGGLAALGSRPRATHYWKAKKSDIDRARRAGH